MPKVRFEPSGIVAEAKAGETVLDVARRSDVPIDSICGGRGICGRCQVQLVSGSMEPTKEDLKLLGKRKVQSGSRLACRLKVLDDLTIETPEYLGSSKHVILESSDDIRDMDPVVKELVLHLKGSSLEHPISIHSQFDDVLLDIHDGEWRVPLSALKALAKVSPDGQDLKVAIRENEVLRIQLGNGGGIYGLAVDVGSTTVVAYLMDLRSGKVLAVHSLLNPQIKHGDDVISRITYSMANQDGRKELQDLVIGCINQLAASCCETAKLDPENIMEIMLVGNTAMHHSVFGLDQRLLTLVPFAPVTSEALEYKGFEIGVKMSPEGYACALPNVAGFVGADHVAVLLASNLDELSAPHMVIDIGTNGEISVGDDAGIFSASVAAGPAFEGGNLSCGMRGAEGAIDHVTIDKDLNLEYSTIGGKRPRGICGSGAIDLVSEMFLAGIIDTSGKIQQGVDPERVKKKDGECRYVLVESAGSSLGREVSFTQEDIVQIQFAKGALHAAGEILMERRGIEEKDLHGILLAGAFGNFVDPESARNIGLFPEVPLERIKGIGNAAGSGAKMALMSKRLRLKASALAKELTYVELAAQQDFEDRFYASLYFPHLDWSKFPEVTSRVRR
ncbi:MAG: ASKHA domain-containing protein [Methanomassiliicoccales archaeon]|nr:ASKHA domain-containing protein [Methanomassiliicoccales archaeon]